MVTVIFMQSVMEIALPVKKLSSKNCLSGFIFRYQDLVEKYSVSAETIINNGFL
jgi:hypothetical protein